MVNSIVWLQAVVEMITNEIAKTLNILAKQQTKICNAIYQNHLALDYLLASEDRVREKFNRSDCCLQTDDEGKVTEEITDKMKSLLMSLCRPGRDSGAGSQPQGVQDLNRGKVPCLGSTPDVTLPNLPVTVVLQDHYGSQYRKKDSCSCTDAMEI
jgi:hypothetical protein